mgnify:FL=1
MTSLKSLISPLLLPAILVFTHYSYSLEFNFHDHQQDQSSSDTLTVSNSGIALTVTANNAFIQNVHGLQIAGGKNLDKDYSSKNSEGLKFSFFEQDNQPVSMEITKVVLKRFEPNLAKDRASVELSNGKTLAKLDGAMDFTGNAGVMSDRHASNSWHFNSGISVEDAFSIVPGQSSGFYVYSIEAQVLDKPVQFVNLSVSNIVEGKPYSHKIEFQDEAPESVVFSLLQSPPGMVLDAKIHTLNWTPDFKAQGQYPINILATDKEGQTSQQSFTLQVENHNQLPLFTSIPVLKGKETQPYVYQLAALDKDQEPVFYKILQAPEGMQLNEHTHVLTWRPGYSDAGTHTVAVAAQDAFDMGIQQFSLEIKDKNRAPVIEPIGVQPANENSLFKYTLLAKDPDNDPLVYKLQHAPKSMTMDAATGVISWPVDYSQAGLAQVNVQVFDGKNGLSESLFNIEVENVNRLPKVLSAAKTQAKENSPYRYHLVLDDLDRDDLKVTLEDGPKGMTLNAVSNTLHWHPDFEDHGTHSVQLSIHDGIDEVDYEFALAVVDNNRAPVFEKPSPLMATEGESSHWWLKATDLDDDDLTFSLSSPPKGMTLNSKSGKLSWTPNFEQASYMELHVSVNDTRGTKALMTLPIQIRSVNRPPKWLTHDLPAAQEGQPYFIELKGLDADGDKIKYQLLQGPKGMTLDAQKGYLQWQANFRQAGDLKIRVGLTDGHEEIEKSLSLKVVNVNRAPAFTSTPLLKAVENQVYKSALTATDPDDGALTFELLSAPKGMVLNAENNTLNFTAHFNQAGFYPVKIRVTDEQGAQALQQFTLQVDNQNRQPTFISQPRLSITEGQHYLYHLQGQDADNDRLSYRLLSAPSAMVMQVNGQSLSWRPGFKDDGRHEVMVSVSDGVKEVIQSFTLLVNNKNRGPRINSLPLQSVTENQVYKARVAAFHPDGMALNYQLITAPNTMQIDNHQGLITWQTGFQDAGTHLVEVEVTDEEGLTKQLRYPIIVKDVNRAPYFVSPPVTQGQLNVRYRYALMAKDEDWNALSYKLLSGPNNMVLDESQRVLYWPRGQVTAGEHSVRLQVSDGSEQVEQSFKVTVPSKIELPLLNGGVN